ncbi:MAG TPA: hypothetical protein VM031_01265 [Phycisphaerae bacterium]|nr:hypothetical protein [Phycisphaerae bacterium]
MARDYSVETCRHLAEAFEDAAVLRPMRTDRYDPGAELTYDMTGVFPARSARVTAVVERFVGGGYAGQVYRARVKDVTGGDGYIEGLAPGRSYAIKILVPPSRFSELFRNAIYFLAFQSPFQLQVNPAAARAGALWQKLIRRAAGLRFGTERAVVDVLATFVDPAIGSCGEISEWLDGRTWRFEVDEELLDRWSGRLGDAEDPLGSPEYRAKKRFMAELVELLHEMGAPELARQYEWWTCKSQPNCLKRRDGDADPAAGLTAVDFRAGLALLPVLPMSPGDFALIARGLVRGRIVQFDRGDFRKLDRFLDAHAEDFADMRPAVEELKAADACYRDSQVDVVGHNVRLLYDSKLWCRLRESAVTGWRVRGLIDEDAELSLRAGRFRTCIFWLLGMIPLLGRALRKLWGRADYRGHYARLLTDADYLARAFHAHVAEKLIGWHRKGRIGAAAAERIRQRPIRIVPHLPMSILPAMLHRMLTDKAFAAEKLRYVFVRPVRLYFHADEREQWLRDMVAEGRRNHMVTDEDAERILGRIKEPFIQKYLKSLAVHVCTLPVTQIVSVAVATWYYLTHPELTEGQRAAAVAAILLAFQVTPISPGSLCRGLYVLWLVIRERDFRNYNIAVFLGFFKYIGYLAFPIQMAYRYPALARFMAGHWATGAVHIVPVFGERGALLEHFVFDLFYNYPLTIRRRMRLRAEAREGKPVRHGHLPLCVLGGAGLLAGIDAAVWQIHGFVPELWNVWYGAIWAPILAGAFAARHGGGAQTGRRIIFAAATGLTLAVAYAAANFGLTHLAGAPRALKDAALLLSWSAFLFVILSTFAALLHETHARR